MTASEAEGPERFRLLATFLVGRAVAVAAAPAGRAAYTDGDAVFVSADRSRACQRSEVLAQCALLRAGSLDPRVVKRLRGRPHVARRYLALEGRRALTELARHVPLAAALAPDTAVVTTTPGESLDLARGRAVIANPPEWFGIIDPASLLQAGSGPSARATDKDLRPAFDLPEQPEPDDDEDNDPEGNGTSRILKLLGNPMVNSSKLADLLRKLLGTSRASGDSDAGAQMRAGSVRRGRTASGDARPLPTPIKFVVGGKPVAVTGLGGAWYPEWDVHGNRYRPEWCRVLGYPLTTSADTSAAAVPHDDVLRRRLARVGLGPKGLRRRTDGEELDIDALLDLVVDIRSGHSPGENVYAETRKLARNLGVLILFDTSGSATDTDPDGLAVHEHHRRAAAVLATTLEELGDRVAVYAFRSDSRHAVHLPAIKTFGRRFGAVERARLAKLEPAGYTRLGAGIRGAGRILDTEAGTPYRLLIVLTDALPYDHGYESRYAEADTRKAVDELRADGIASLCLTIGAATTTDTLERVFGPAGYAEAATLSGLSPHMDELFTAALRELSAPKPRGR
ncbi:nitric oxide reductase activation protein NorD [Nocardia testacea]|uniref:nitric oxide reductase activation protein NorD n=1 Tax=Nocardia testacea TaxID=248551 RepID=UPI003A8ADCD4